MGEVVINNLKAKLDVVDAIYSRQFYGNELIILNEDEFHAFSELRQDLINMFFSDVKQCPHCKEVYVAK